MNSICKKKCGCLNHDLFTNGGDLEFSYRSRAFLSPNGTKRGEFAELLRRKLVNERTNTICTQCLAYGKRKMEEVMKPKPDDMDAEEDEETIEIDTDDNDKNDSLHHLIEALNSRLEGLDWKEMDDRVKEALCKLSENLGKTIKSQLFNEKYTMKEQCRSFNSLISIDPEKWYAERNRLLTKFISGCTGVDYEVEETNRKKLNAAIHCVEQILYTRNSNLVTPFAFMRNILTYIISKSKMACNIAGASESCGSYTIVNSLLNSPSKPLTIQDESDVTVTFDNEQKVGRHSGRIRESSKQALSIITTVGVIEVNPRSNFQFVNVCRADINLSNSISAVTLLEDYYRQCYRQYRFKFTNDLLKEVVNEQFLARTLGCDLKDYVDIATDASGMSVCPSCRHTETSVFIVCSSCHFDTSFFDHGYDKYNRTESKHIGKPTISHAEPTLENPATFENVKLVAENISGELFAEGKMRQWAVIMCDGVPYDLIAKIQDRYKLCSSCSEVIAIDQLTEHKKCHHEDNINYSTPFSNIFFRPGPGHIEMNMGRKLLSFMWEPLIKHIAQCLGFRTPNAMKVFKNGVDHHRTLQVLESLLHGLTKELLLPYVRSCLRLNTPLNPSVKGYFDWYKENVNSQKYAYMYNLTFYYLLSFKMYNEGVRKNNSDIMMAGRTIFAPLFYLGHHPRYQHLLLRDMIERVNYPPQVQEYAKMTESHSASGLDIGGQGGDFIHEELNRTIKSYLQGCGIPTKNNWVNIIRKAKLIGSLHERFIDNSNMKTGSGKKKPKRFEHEITMVRKLLRGSNYLTNFFEQEALESIDGNDLDEYLCDFTFLAEENYQAYKDELSENGTYGTKKLQPIFVTENDRKEFEKIENKSINEIIEETRKLVNRMKNKDIALEIAKKLDKKSKMKKNQYIELFYESEKSLEVQEAEIAFDILQTNLLSVDEHTA